MFHLYIRSLGFHTPLCSFSGCVSLASLYLSIEGFMNALRVSPVFHGGKEPQCFLYQMKTDETSVF